MRSLSSVLAAVVALLLLAVPLVVHGTPAAALALAVLVGLFSGLWPRVSGLRPWIPSSAVLALAGAAATGIALVRVPAEALDWWPACVAVAVLVLFAVQLLRGNDAEGKVAALAAGLPGVLLSTAGAGWAATLPALVSDAAWPGYAVAAACVVAGVAVALVLHAASRNGWGVGQGEAAAVPADRWSAVAVGLAGVLGAGLPAALLVQVVA